MSTNDVSFVLIHGRQHPRAVNTPECTPRFSLSTSSASSSDQGAFYSSQGSESDVLQSLRQSFSLTALASLASELLTSSQPVPGDEVIRLLVAVLKEIVAPAGDVLILNACESLAAVQMDVVPSYANEVIAVIPNHTAREEAACHYAVLQLRFGSLSKEAFARYYDSLGGTMCLAVAQNLVDLLWAVGGWDHSGH